jgi:hypothetical protein
MKPFVPLCNQTHIYLETFDLGTYTLVTYKHRQKYYVFLFGTI